MKKVLVAGATGYLGRFVVREFKKQGYWVRVLARNRLKLEKMEDYVDEIFIGEIIDSASLLGICSDIDVVFSCIGITKQKDRLTYMDVDYQGNLNLLAEARNAGVAKFIYVSVFNSEELNEVKCIQAKTKFEEELKMSGMDYAIVYPNGFFSDMLEYLSMAERGKGYLFGTGENKINPIHGEDLAEVCVKAAGSGVEEIEVGGPEIFTHNEILKIAFEVTGKKAKVTRIPLWLVDLIKRSLIALTSVKTHGPIEFFMTVCARDMVAPRYGKNHLRDFFESKKDRV